VGDDDEDIDAEADERLDVADLDGVVAVGGLDLDGAAEFLDGGGERIAVTLPALFLEGIEGQADDRFFLRGEGGGGECEEEGEGGGRSEFHGGGGGGERWKENENENEKEKEKENENGGARGGNGKAVYNGRGIVRLART